MSHPSRMTVLSLAILGLSQYAFAQTEETVQLQDVHVIGYKIKKVGEETLNRQALDNGMVEDANDLVRYQAGVGVKNGGRFGNKGFAIRGQDGNRVAITVDGVGQAAYQDSGILSTYGLTPSSNAPLEMEFMRSANIQRGADSWSSGNGAIGGAVGFKTKEAQDFIPDGQDFGFYGKAGYSSKNREWLSTVGAAYAKDQLEALVLYSHRDGHETKHAGGGEDVIGRARGIPDAQDKKKDSVLAKVAYQINDEHRVGFSTSYQDETNHIDEKSYDGRIMPGGWLVANNTRIAKDTAKLETYGLFYEYSPTDSVLSSLKFNYDYQKLENRAQNFTTNIMPDRPGRPQKHGDVRLDDRRYENDLNQFIVDAKFDTVKLGDTTHDFSLKSGYTHQDIKMTGQQIEAINRSHPIVNDQQSFFTPVKQKSWFISAEDRINFTETVFGHMGVRYDKADYKVDNNVKLDGTSENYLKNNPSPNRNMSQVTWTTGLGVKLNDTWTLNSKVSSGFRMPTAADMYYRYGEDGSGIIYLPNPELKPEKSTNFEIALNGKSDIGYFNASIYHSRYRNLISDMPTILGTQTIEVTCRPPQVGKCQNTDFFAKMMNIDKANITGIDLDGALYLDQMGWTKSKWIATGAFSYGKGSSSNGRGLLALQPVKVVLGLGYESNDSKWGAMSNVTYHGKKSSSNTTVQALDLMEAAKPNPDYVQDMDFPYRPKSAFVFDASAYYKPSKNIVIRAGVYNLFDKKYATWDDVRGINMYGHVNRVDENGSGLNRFTAPRRNFAVSLEAKF